MLKEGEIRIPSGCAISGIINRNKELMNCSNIVSSMALMRERSNGLGGGFAAYGIYPGYSKYYALHLFYDNHQARHQVEPELQKSFEIIHSEEIKTRRTRQVRTSPIIYRYFNDSLCVGCHRCVELCPTRAFKYRSYTAALQTQRAVDTVFTTSSSTRTSTTCWTAG